MRTKTIHYFKEWNNEVTGGVAYFKDVISSLYNYKLVGIDATHHFEKFKLLQRATKIKINQNLFSGAFILNYTPVTLLNRKKLNDSIAIFHHYDESLFFNNKKIYRQFYKNYFVNLKYVKKIVVVSNYWKEWLQTNYNIQNVEVIYNSLDTEKITNIAYKTEFQELKKKMSRNTDKIVVYIGASKAGKGYEKAYEILKNYGNIELISTGPNELKLPIKNFNHLEYDDYIKLLNASDIVLALSNFKEGWNRIAAEAMFLKKPVIGSLSGGLSELLIEGGQLVYKPELDNLYSQIEQAYINRESLGLSGKIFVQKFDKGYFSEAWQNLIKQNFF